jgi:hypothetical protein
MPTPRKKPTKRGAPATVALTVTTTELLTIVDSLRRRAMAQVWSLPRYASKGQQRAANAIAKDLIALSDRLLKQQVKPGRKS